MLLTDSFRGKLNLMRMFRKVFLFIIIFLLFLAVFPKDADAQSVDENTYQCTWVGDPFFGTCTVNLETENCNESGGYVSDPDYCSRLNYLNCINSAPQACTFTYYCPALPFCSSLDIYTCSWVGYEPAISCTTTCAEAGRSWPIQCIEEYRSGDPLYIFSCCRSLVIPTPIPTATPIPTNTPTPTPTNSPTPTPRAFITIDCPSSCIAFPGSEAMCTPSNPGNCEPLFQLCDGSETNYCFCCYPSPTPTPIATATPPDTPTRCDEYCGDTFGTLGCCLPIGTYASCADSGLVDTSCELPYFCYCCDTSSCIFVPTPTDQPPLPTQIPITPLLAQGDCDPGEIDTAVGCVPASNINELIAFFLRWSFGVGGGIGFLLILYAGFIIITSSGDPQKLQGGKELLTAALSGILLLIFSVFVLEFVGVRILNIPGFGQ